MENILYGFRAVFNAKGFSERASCKVYAMEGTLNGTRNYALRYIILQIWPVVEDEDLLKNLNVVRAIDKMNSVSRMVKVFF